jgi:hypothetical protein
VKKSRSNKKLVFQKNFFTIVYKRISYNQLCNYFSFVKEVKKPGVFGGAMKKEVVVRVV